MAQRLAADAASATPSTPVVAADAEPEEQDRAIAATLERAVAAGPGVGQARPGAARRAARRRRRRRRRLWADDPLRGRRRGAARGGAAAARPLRPGAHPPPRAHSSTYRYCTNFAVTGSALEPERFIAAAGGARRLGAGRGRRGDPEGARPHRRARARGRGVRGRRGGLAPRRRRHARPGRRARGAPGRCGPSPPASPHTARPPSRALAAARWPSSAAPACTRSSRSSGSHTLDGGPTLNPSTYELLAGDPRGARRGGARAAQLLQRRDGRRARRRALRQAGARRARAQPAGGSRRGGRRC